VLLDEVNVLSSAARPEDRMNRNNNSYVRTGRYSWLLCVRREAIGVYYPTWHRVRLVAQSYAKGDEWDRLDRFGTFTRMPPALRRNGRQLHQQGVETLMRNIKLSAGRCMLF
jgi:hypothetical protein